MYMQARTMQGPKQEWEKRNKEAIERIRQIEHDYSIKFFNIEYFDLNDSMAKTYKIRTSNNVGFIKWSKYVGYTYNGMHRTYINDWGLKKDEL